MGDDCLTHLRICADYESHRQIHLQVLNALEVIGQGGEPVGGVVCSGGFAVLSEPLRHAAWPPRYRPDTPDRFDRSTDPVEFLQRYAIAIWETRGDGHVMANWFPMVRR
jgi:hypothetical protein